MANFLLVVSLVVCITLQPHLAVASNSLVEHACESSVHKNYCIDLLEPHLQSNEVTNLKGLAFIALRIAEKNASDTSIFIHKALESYSMLKPEVQQALSDCSEHYLTVVELIDDAINALVSHADYDVTKFVKAVVADIDGCDSSIKDKDLTVEHNNLALRQILDICLTVAHAYAQETTE